MEKIKALLKKILEKRTVKSLFLHMKESEIGLSSIAVAYYLLLSLFPFLMTVGNIIPYLNLNSNETMRYMREVVPSDIFDSLEPVVYDLLTNRSSGVLSISAIVTLWAASQGITSLQNAMDKAYAITHRRNAILTRILSVVILVILVLAAIMGVGVLGFGATIFHFLKREFHWTDTTLQSLISTTNILAIIGVFLLLCLLYLIVPNVVIPKIRYVLAGSLFATVMCFILSQVFGFYVQYFATRVSSYQMIGTVIVLMLWLVFSARILIMGCVINSVVQELATGEHARERSKMISNLLRQKVENKIERE
ncbi:membrane protein [Pilibacter termitis]|uniref:Membrane protein n=1 Tax=Pilibacter termitis TaxID=263852 RepID=A0A1T4L1J3_9ENTE|nr:YihY/virulence factor BrkB family protein [Pilibacter termitis]SJZ48407.1 membrane protein [Pilibacter termitis]